MFQRFDESARRAMFFSRFEASRAGSRQIGTEHVLLGILRERDRRTTQLWESLHVDPAAIRAKFPAVEDNVDASTGLPLSDNAKKVLAFAVHEAETARHPFVTPLHLVAAIVRVPDSRAAAVLVEEDVDLEMLAEVVRLVLEQWALHAEDEKRTPLILRESHYAALDAMAESMKMRDPRRDNRQALILAIMDAIAASPVVSGKFASPDELRKYLVAALAKV